VSGWFVLLAYLSAVNPPRLRPHLPGSPDRARPLDLLRAAVAVALVGLVLVLAAGSILDGLDITTETWQIAAGIVSGLVGARVVVAPRLAEAPAGSWLVPLAFPMLLTPQLVVLAIRFGSTGSVAAAWGWMLVALAAGAAVGLVRCRRPELWWAVSRLLGATLVVVSLAMVVSGIRDV
jgi:small neutral amino acid transporter SnatA (MarC family)